MANTKITTNVIADDAITSAKIADDAITSALIADDAITSALIADDAVGADQLASSAVVTASIVDDAVTGAKIENAVTIATSVTSPLVDGQNFKVNGGQGSDGQVLTSTGSGVAWEDAAGGVAGISSSADATAITIDSSERVGIGTTSPSTLLHLSNASNPAIRITDTTNTLNIEITATDTVGYFGTESNHATAFITNNTERIRIDTSGLVGIGRTPSSSTGSMLQVEGNDGIAMRRPSQTNNFTLRPNASTDGMRFTQEGAGDRMFIDSSGHVGIGATPSTTGFGGTFKYLGVQGGSGYGVFNGQTTSTSVNAGAASFFGSTVGTAGFALLGGMQVINIASSASNAEGGLLFYTGSGGSIPERMRIDNSGKVGINTTTMNATLNVQAGSTNTQAASFTGIGGNVIKFVPYAATGGFSSLTHTNDVCILAESAGGIVIAHHASGDKGIRIVDNGDLEVGGALSKASGSFKISHPLDSKKDTHHLVHSFIEGPQADLIYRGKVNLVGGSATVNIDTVAGMSEGTFVALNTDVQVFTSNETDWDNVKGSVVGNILTITCQNNSSTATVSWLVIGERQDQHMIDANWTDENGKVIVESLKETE